MTLRFPWIAACVIGAAAIFSVESAFAADVVLEEAIPYAKGGQADLLLDLARPGETNGLRPGLVFIHGGGWIGGGREMYRNEIQQAAKRGYVAVSVQYRLTKPDSHRKAKNPFPAQVEDVKAAVRWLRANAEKYHIDPNRIGATGGSAGGHLSLMLGVTDSSAGLEGSGGNPNVSSRVQAVVNFFGPTDMAHLHETSKQAAGLLEILLGGPPAERAEQYRAASPIHYASKDDPPTLTIHGTSDPVVPPDQATLFDAAMKKAGAPHTLLLLEGEGHGFKREAAAKANAAMFAFFDQHLRNGR
jgi:acetyl esterase/lipase